MSRVRNRVMNGVKVRIRRIGFRRNGIRRNGAEPLEIMYLFFKPRFLASSIFFAIKMHKALHFSLKIQKLKIFSPNPSPMLGAHWGWGLYGDS